VPAAAAVAAAAAGSAAAVELITNNMSDTATPGVAMGMENVDIGKTPLD
jgi:hypothetical protein